MSQNLPLVRHIISCCCPESLEMRIPTFSVHSLTLPLTAPELCFTEPASVPWLALPNRPHLGKSLLSGLRLILSFQTSTMYSRPTMPSILLMEACINKMRIIERRYWSESFTKEARCQPGLVQSYGLVTAPHPPPSASSSI